MRTLCTYLLYMGAHCMHTPRTIYTLHALNQSATYHRKDISNKREAVTFFFFFLFFLVVEVASNACKEGGEHLSHKH